MAKNKAKKAAAPGPEGTHCDGCKTTTAEQLVEVKGPHGVSNLCPGCKAAHDGREAMLAAAVAPLEVPGEDVDEDLDDDDEDEGDDDDDDGEGEEESDDQAAGGAGGGEVTP